jgi:hypothetical protein
VIIYHRQHQEQPPVSRMTLARPAASCGGPPQQAAFAGYAEGRIVGLIKATRRADGLPLLAIHHDITVVSRIRSAFDLREAVAP